ncbi:type 4a pilus biogenesis protein PilO [Halomonas daqingensis]|uniref:Type 4a pilus biogenesis protein PilO n=1 Tax=Billgrantia desiderata TaxID=52021 RepID=A0ABS9B5T9_9GAMM|nr:MULTISPECIES: type 4a pilus biogenesis protein PilO [Halomonas]MCE8037944.1 type 4a pilus biogenesis protein PilO [Halomonas sp. MCCC 1A11062]MCE8042699.1 type 4a pilus biogenesis protein PilO [Halomonas desiderata]MCE8047274.1 type 4a pilus biogenesis protein PilO [Halomonas desiderata]
MSLQAEFRRLRELDWRELDLKESGTWPLLLQWLCCLLVLGLTFAATHWYLAGPKADELQRAEAEEARLLADYRNRAAQAAQLPEMLEQMARLETRMGELMAMLPSGAEIPSLIDSISESALDHHLSIDFIRLRSTVERDFYIERPFDIQVEGEYHHIAGFLAGVAALPRIVTLHDFVLAPVEGSDRLRLSMLARTYSYRPQGGEGAR